MAGRHEQRGLTLMSMVIVLAVLGFFAYITMRLFPVYSEYRSVVSDMNALAEQPGIGTSDPARIKDLLFRRFYVSYVENVKPDHVKIERKGNTGVTLVVAYEVRRPLMYNLDFVAKFDHSVPL